MFFFSVAGPRCLAGPLGNAPCNQGGVRQLRTRLPVPHVLSFAPLGKARKLAQKFIDSVGGEFEIVCTALLLPLHIVGRNMHDLEIIYPRLGKYWQMLLIENAYYDC